MIKIRYFILSSIFTLLSIKGHDGLDKYYSSSFLKNYPQVRASLKQEGFRELYFKTPDGLRLNGLYLERPNATCNVIVCAGWLPGRMEAMATYFALLPEYCNILLFDARGHGKSEGPLFREVWRYGANEYKDIIGGFSFLKQMNNLPNFVCGICSGAFNAARAIIELEASELTAHYNFKGFIFDSGWGSVTKISSTIVISGVEKRLLKCLSAWYTTQVFYGLFHYCFFKPIIQKYESLTNLFDKIHTINAPILFIHSPDDSYADFQDVETLVSLSKNKDFFILNDSFHAKHHLKHKALYKEKLKSFIEYSLAQ